jgi:hypothetical protein
MAMTDSPTNLCTTCGERPPHDALSRCLPCVKAAAEVNRQKRAAAEARVAARGHGPKLAEAVQALQATGRLPPNLRPVEFVKRIHVQLRADVERGLARRVAREGE